MLYGEKLNRQAVFIGANGETDRLNRIPFMSGSFNEAWLQELLEENPSIIPSGDVSSEYAPLICIGREVPVGSGETQGYIDNLYITPTGRIVIVETKLFRNQESRRTVVAQIIDYAKELQNGMLQNSMRWHPNISTARKVRLSNSLTLWRLRAI